MLPVPLVVTIAFAALYAVIGGVLGILSGWLTALALKSPRRLKVDAGLGSAGFLLGGFISFVMPWHTNTITYELSGGTHVTSTMNNYQHPERVAVVVAIILPILYELYRKRLHANG